MSSQVQTILVVDDEPLIRFMLVDELDAEGFEVLDAANAEEALRLIEARPDIRVVLTDIQMPGTMDGLALAHALRSGDPALGLIIASGATFPGVADLPIAARFFVKPYELSKIATAIRELLVLAA